MQESRHHIKTRMLKNAARVWGYPETEAENNFDPLVSMLLSACSIELEKISGEVQASRGRVLERLVQLLSPDVLTGALPAHAIAHALPLEAATEISADAQFYTHRKISTVAETEDFTWKDIFFTPTSSFRLNKSSVRFMATGNLLYRVNQSVTKEAIANADIELPAATLWLGIDEASVNLHESLFYFDFRNEAAQQLFLHQLPKASWNIDGQQLQHLPGYGYNEISGETIDLPSIINGDHDVKGNVKKHINAFYKSFFITLLDEKGVSVYKEAKPVTPAVITQAFTGKEAKLLQQHTLRWICIQFPETIPNRLLQDVICTMNCFPVMNSRLHTINHRAQEMINIIPLQTDDLFLDLDEVSNDEGKAFNIHPQETEESFTTLMRNGGVGRFDERDAAMHIDYLLQLLRDDSAAFSSLGNDFINTELKQLQQSMNKLEQRLFSKSLNRDQIPYLIIRNNEKKLWQNFLIRYWSTNGKEGNHIKAGTGLQLYKGGSLEGNQAFLVTTTKGGRNKLSTTESVLAYKSALLSKNRLVTNEDIKAFCHYQLGERVKRIEVKKGVMIHAARQQGFSKTIDVFIEIHKRIFEQMEESGELSFWTDNLQLLLKEKSSDLMPYRVFIKDAA